MWKTMGWMLAMSVLSTVGAKALEVGQSVPAFEVTTTGGPFKAEDLKGKWTVIYFYPKSFTGGCTKEACSLRDGYAELMKTGAVLLGVSLDGLDTQKKFKAEYTLPFELVADDQKVLTKAFHVLALGGFMAQRKTFIVNPEGNVAYVFESVNVGKHDAEVLEQLKTLQAAAGH